MGCFLITENSLRASEARLETVDVGPASTLLHLKNRFLTATWFKPVTCV